jgi:hypothetical protein
MSKPFAFSERVLQIVAEDKIRTAIADGEFDRLPGLGKPLAIFDEPYDPYWWVRRKMKREQLVPGNFAPSPAGQANIR